MKWIIAGSRDVTDYDTVKRAASRVVRRGDTIISGAARGVDKLGEKFADRNNLQVDRYPAEWDKYGKGAGYRRNHRMALEADGLVAVWDGRSPGTKNMIEEAHKARLVILVEYV